jgi:hypothetical protein
MTMAAVAGLEAGKAPAGLVAHWNFDEGSGVEARDSSPNGLHGAIKGAVWKSGKKAHALQFNRTASVEVPNHPALEITGDITIAAWVWKDSPNEAKRWDAILSKTPGKWDYELLTSKAKSDELAFYSPQGEPKEVYSGKPVPSKRWCHVAVTRSGDQVRMYLDGELASTATMGGKFPTNGGALQIGLDGAKQVNGMIGLIDEVYLFNRALSQSEIKALM